MIMDAHNAHLLELNGKETPDSGCDGTVASPGPIRWTGDCEVYIDEDTTTVVRGQALLEVYDAIIDMPQNFPVMPDIGDVLQIVRLPMPPISEANLNESFRVTKIDRGMIMMGKLRLTCKQIEASA